ncbi:hypothetical protein F905_01099 [Acinetobacter sp. CIP 53.82]|nr:hypothetical protein F905_01099 [Acinetobacter sp. CIP 53.82]
MLHLLFTLFGLHEVTEIDYLLDEEENETCSNGLDQEY